MARTGARGGTRSSRTRAPIPLSARAVLTVDLGALRANWARLNEVSGRADLKSDLLQELVYLFFQENLLRGEPSRRPISFAD